MALSRKFTGPDQVRDEASRLADTTKEWFKLFESFGVRAALLRKLRSSKVDDQRTAINKIFEKRAVTVRRDALPTRLPTRPAWMK
jgi:hypothetical protein